MVKVKAWRKKQKKRQAEVAEKLGISQGVYSRYEAMKVPMPPLLAVKMIAWAEGALKYADFYSWLERGKKA